MATVTLPHSWSDGDVIYASEVMAQFNALKEQINGGIEAVNIANGGVGEDEIADGAVTDPKVDSGIDAVKIADGSVSNTEFQYLGGVTSDVQTQLDDKDIQSATKSEWTINGAATQSLSKGVWMLVADEDFFVSNAKVQVRISGSWETTHLVTEDGATVVSDGSNTRIWNDIGTRSVDVTGYRFKLDG